jgi:hypothetical protein
MDPRETGCDCVIWAEIVQNTVQKWVFVIVEMNLWVLAQQDTSE